MHILEEKIRKAVNAGRTALIPFITAGFPSPQSFWGTVRELDASGADIIEIGIPFSDPIADGPVVASASLQAIKDGVSLKYITELLLEHKGEVQSALVLMGYANPFIQYGWERFARDAERAGVKGCIVPDMPYDEAEEARLILQNRGIALIAMVGPNTSEERMARYARDYEGYVYVISVMGTTGERRDLLPNVQNVLTRVRRNFSLPVALGFGLSNPEQLDFLPKAIRPDAAVFGSALLTHIRRGGVPSAFMEKWTRARKSSDKE